ncbi:MULTISPECIES: chemotaxis response regulator protein-glutamate methylesterase [Trichocoleus]|uniref:Protein-glutamate methylesterase/protein-glutamine glutaminase n=1 Tax=Trichocoleus desertorum GB2-A4 TaxID=2933944 RepID=A0ABV0J9E4_9CYAN|nr:chemotaxis response regulator protein-glutamate methylesterase [Trichocoleus sp. FACHB-46]MBD1862603.1 chemotaxis response regulator protein-glutamate methylesterase [Trichocoleus sp. FACHB-46]
MRVAIVNDMLLAVEALRRVVASAPEYEVAWIARNGAEAVTKAAQDTPDLILMDLLMPELDGVAATRQIMAQSPCAIVLVTATVSGHGAKVFEAMGYGALDAVNTPILGPQGQGASGTEVLAKIAMVAKLIGKSTARKSRSPNSIQPDSFAHPTPPLVVIGASTGGPQALRTILSQFPANFPAAVVIIQHVDAQFAPGLTEWMNQQTTIPVKIAQHGQVLQAGTVSVASTNHHLIVQADLTLAYTPEPSQCVYRPSVDVFFNSVAAHWPRKGVAVLLTGMGKDGAMGLKSLYAAGWHTIAQNRETCVVYGMPKAAVELGAAKEVLPLPAIASACMEQVSRRWTRRA